MKLLLVLSALLMASAAFADSPVLNVKITSFTQISPSLTLGEVCGTVTVSNALPTAAKGLIPVSVTADPNTSNPGVYTTLADQSGNFCVMINAYSGTASAEAWMPGAKADSSIAHVRNN